MHSNEYSISHEIVCATIRRIPRIFKSRTPNLEPGVGVALVKPR